MDPLLPALFGIVLLWALSIIFLVRKNRTLYQQGKFEEEKKEKELRLRLFELQLMQALSTGIGYSLDIRKILEVITLSLKGLLPYSTVSYLLPEPSGRISVAVRLEEAVPRLFVEQVKQQLLTSFPKLAQKEIAVNRVDESVTGAPIDDRLNYQVASSYNLPLLIGERTLAVVNISSYQQGLYKDDQTLHLSTIFTQVSTQASKITRVVENEKKKLSAMVGSLSDGIIMVDPLFNPLVINKTAKELLNLTEKENFSQISITLEGKVDLSGVIGRALEKQEVVRIPSFELAGRFIQIDVEPVKDSFGYLLGAVIVVHDTTSVKQLEKLREEFTAMMVHELRTPLTTIYYSVDMMLSDLGKISNEHLKAALLVIKSTGEDMLSIVNELLDIAKIEAGKFTVTKINDDLGKLLQEKIIVFKTLAQKKNIGLNLRMDEVVPLFAFDKRRISQVLENLLSNAIKYTDRGEVVIEAKIERAEQGQQVRVSVIDNGEGINPADLSKLFSKFEQLGKGKTGEKVGTGLGLVVSKGIVEAHGGKMWAESAGIGKGSTFSFTLPLV